MGGRGAFSASGKGNSGTDARTPLNAYAVASLNKGVAGGTTTEKAIERFREQLMNEKKEYSAYIDDAGYIHSLASSEKENRTRIAPISTIEKEKNVHTVIHNHPHGGSDGRVWGGPLSSGDLKYITKAYSESKGNINTIIATAKEGIYTAKVTKKVTQEQVKEAIQRSEASLKGKTYQSEKASWKAVNKAYTAEFADIGVTISFTNRNKRKDKLVTEKIGVY